MLEFVEGACLSSVESRDGALLLAGLRGEEHGFGQAAVAVVAVVLPLRAGAASLHSQPEGEEVET